MSSIFNTFLYNNYTMEPTFTNNNIAMLRKQLKLSQRELANAVGTSQANLSRWEQGLNQPSIMECWKLADFFNVSIDVLCGREDY